jgi:Ca2+-binding RTX toxin-like protein
LSRTFSFNTFYDPWVFDFLASTDKPFPASFGSSSVHEVTTAGDPLQVHTLSSLADGFDTLTGSFAIHRTGTSSFSGGVWTADYLETVDNAHSTVSSVGPTFGLEGLTVNLGASVAYSTVAGKNVGQLVQNGDLIVATPGSDNLKTTNLSEKIQLGEGNNAVQARGGNDSIIAGSGNDTIDGGTGNDTMSAGDGNDTYRVDSSLDRVIEAAGGGSDAVLSSATYSLSSNIEKLSLLGSGTIDGTGNNNANFLSGNSSANHLNGKDANDTIVGNGGDDSITGGLGRDSMSGGSGADHFMFLRTSETGKTATTRDIISDFTVLADKLDLSAIDAIAGTALNDAFAYRGTGAFTHHAGELRFFHELRAGVTVTVVAADTTGDGIADLQIELSHNLTLARGDFIV